MRVTAFVRHLLSSDEEVRREERCREAREHSSSPESECVAGAVVRLYGTISSVVTAPRCDAPVLVVRLDAGDCTVELRWLGRRRIAGIEAGRRILVKGRLSLVDGRLGIFNPSYELTA